MEEMDTAPSSEQVNSKKRILEKSHTEEPSPKKQKTYSVKQFRKDLHSSDKLNALKQFLSLLSGSSKHDHIFDYLKNGGNCLELLQTLESDSTIPPTLVFDLVTQLLLGISAKHGQYYSSAYESCRYLINNYLPVIHKMLGLSSSKEERKVCLKLLTAMATFSSNLARDILMNVKFHSANIELLTKHTGEKNSIRDCFLQLLTAFLIDSDMHTLSVLLDKSGLLTSIISGLQYDDADTVCLVITAMKNHILENASVTKTTKMHVFNTAVVKDIVNLYNWKGPDGFRAMEKNNKTIFEVDKLAKSKVSECVHEFLLVLCTSHKFGVIFRDHLVGLGRKNLNGLLYTVLDSLDRPWEHSYASELVINICKSCPDLAKTMWSILKPYLEPRLTEKWLNAMNFASKLIHEMEPACVEYCAKDLTPQQISQVIEVLTSPSPVLRVLLVENKPNDESAIKNHILKLLFQMLTQINIWLTAAKEWASAENFQKISNYLSNYVTKHYPDAQSLLEDWNNRYLVHNNKENNKQEHLVNVLDILSLYKAIAPQHLYSLTTSSFDFKEFLIKLSATSEEDGELIERLQIKITSIFVDIDHSFFLPKSELFSYIIPVLLKAYHRDRSRHLQQVLFKLLQNTGIFDSNLFEIGIWINGLFNLGKFSENFASDFVHIMKDVSENHLEYQKEISEVADDDGNVNLEWQELIEELSSLDTNDYFVARVKHRHFSPAILGLLKYCAKNNSLKSLKKYLEFVLLNLFHNQTNLQKFMSVVQKHQHAIPSNVFNYAVSWFEGQSTPLLKLKGSLTNFVEFSQHFLNDSPSNEMLEASFYPDVLVDILRMSTFYFANLVANGTVSQNHSTNWTFVINYVVQNNSAVLDDFCLELVLKNPCLIDYFNITQLGKNTPSDISTRAVLDVILNLRKLTIPLNSYIEHYSNKIFHSVKKLLKHPKKYSGQKDIKEFLEVFHLAYSHCMKIISESLHLLCDNNDGDNYVALHILVYSIERILILCKGNHELHPIDNDLVSKVTLILVALNRENKDSAGLSRVLRQYFEFFPHSIAGINRDLFSSILKLTEYNKDNVDLAVFLLEKDLTFTKEIEANIFSVCELKGLILPLVHVLLAIEAPGAILEAIYGKLESSIIKAIEKPQKVGQHFSKNYNIAALIGKFMPLQKCATFANKVQKFEVAEVFHVKLLEACYNKLITESDVDGKQLNNIIMTFIHLEIFVFKRKLETEDELNKANGLTEIFDRILEKILAKDKDQIVINETSKTFFKFALKFGVNGQYNLLAVLRKLVKLIRLEKDDAKLLLDMLVSHSEFLNVVLGEHSPTKLEVLTLLLVISETWKEVMDKSHVAVVLSAYRGMVTKCDRTVLALLKLYESNPEQTRFYDFKPFLWGRAAATHYSVRTQIGSSLTRQPKISDVLGILKEELVNSTITNYPLKGSLRDDNEELSEDLHCYDLKFLLPLFSHILAPEQQVKTYVFIRSGALSLTVLGLACHDKEVRQAACHVLSRLHFHLEARQTGKDNLLWIRFVEAVCKGVAVLPNFKLNSFSAIFFARMALILTNPKHIMYSPLSLYLTAKQDLDLSTIPELYTLLFSSDVNYKEHRNFILEILRDGMKTEKDFVDFLKSMGYKLFSELFSSCLSDFECKLLILDVLGAVSKIPLGVKILIENYSLASQLNGLTTSILANTVQALPKLFNIIFNIVKARTDKYTNQIIFDISQNIFESDAFLQLKDCDVRCFYEIIYHVFTNSPTVVRNKRDFVDKLTNKVNDRFSNYIKEYGCSFVREKCSDLQEDHKLHFLRLLVYKLLS